MHFHGYMKDVSWNICMKQVANKKKLMGRREHSDCSILNEQIVVLFMRHRYFSNILSNIMSMSRAQISSTLFHIPIMDRVLKIVIYNLFTDRPQAIFTLLTTVLSEHQM